MSESEDEKRERAARCVECYSDLAVTRSSAGRICFACQERLNADVRRRVLAGEIVTQGIDPDGTPVHCMVGDCIRSATIMIQWPCRGMVGHLSACDTHTDLQVETFAKLRSGEATIADEPS